MVAPGPEDPILGWRDGPALWKWLREGTSLLARPAQTIQSIQRGEVDLVLDTIPGALWERWQVSRLTLARQLAIPWVSLEAEDGGAISDAVLQAQATMALGTYVPWGLGETGPGLMLAFRAVSALLGRQVGHIRLGAASCLAHLVSGDLSVLKASAAGDEPEASLWQSEGPWREGGRVVGAVTDVDGDLRHERTRDRAWRLQHLRHRNAGCAL